MTYEASVSKFIFSGSIGELKLSVQKSSEPDGMNLLEIRADAVSKGFFPALFGIKVKDRFTALVDPSDFGLQVSTREVEEGKTRREYKSVFNREVGKVLFTETDRTKEKAEPRTKERPFPPGVQDVLSALYFVRTRPLKQGDVVPIPLSDLGENYSIEVVAGKREKVTVGPGKFKAIQVDARIFDGRFTKRSGELIVWVSDDDRKIPLRARLKMSGYTATIELKTIKQ